MTKMLGSDAIVRSLELAGTEVCFGIPGGAILPTYDAFYNAFKRGEGPRHVLTRHEQGAGHMAEGYARASGKPGVAIATSGPGATNLVTPIADAWMDSTPLVCITGQVPSNLIGSDAFQETDAYGITLPIVKHSWLVQHADDIAHAIKAAFHVATTGRCGPVLVDITKDAQQSELDFSWPDAIDLPGLEPAREGERPPDRGGGESDPCRVAADLLRRRRRAERRGDRGAAHPRRADRHPGRDDAMGKGAFPDSHPLCFGHPGMHGGKWGNWALNKADLIIAVGVRFDDRVTGKVSTFAPDAKVIHFDIDAAEISKIRHADIPLVGPLKLATAELTKRLRETTSADYTGPRRGSGRSRSGASGSRSATTGRTSSSRRRSSRWCATCRPRAIATRSTRPASVSTRCGRCSTSCATSRGASSPPAASGRWATASRRRSAPRRPAPTQT